MNTAQKREHKINGLCVYCSDKAVISGLCSKHWITTQKAHKKFYGKLKLIGRCPRCGNDLMEEADEGYLTCFNCRTTPMICVSTEGERKRFSYAVIH